MDTLASFLGERATVGSAFQSTAACQRANKDQAMGVSAPDLEFRVLIENGKLVQIISS